MKRLLLTSLLFSTSAMAHNECNVHVDQQVSLENRVLTVRFADDQELKMNGQTVTLNGQTLSLTASQQADAQGYYQGFMHAAPATADIALDAIGLAGEAVAKAFGEISGEDSDLVEDISAEFNELRNEMHQRFYDDNGNVRFSFNDMDNGDFLGAEFEEEFEERIESVVERSVGGLLMAIGSQMLFGDGMDAFEARMEKFGEDMEKQMEARADQIELRANELCESLASVDEYETRLSESVDGLSELNVLTVTH